MRYLKNIVSIFGVAIAMLASLANLVIGLITLFHAFGGLALIGILLFPLTIASYPFILWIFAGETGYFVLWGILFGVFLLGGFIASAAKSD